MTKKPIYIYIYIYMYGGGLITSTGVVLVFLVLVFVVPGPDYFGILNRKSFLVGESGAWSPKLASSKHARGSSGLSEITHMPGFQRGVYNTYIYIYIYIFLIYIYIYIYIPYIPNIPYIPYIFPIYSPELGA